MKPEITPEILIEDLVNSYPKSVPILMREGIHCLACGEPVWGTLGERIREKNRDKQQIFEVLHRELAE